jgi:hypothetical protein
MEWRSAKGIRSFDIYSGFREFVGLNWRPEEFAMSKAVGRTEETGDKVRMKFRLPRAKMRDKNFRAGGLTLWDAPPCRSSLGKGVLRSHVHGLEGGRLSTEQSLTAIARDNPSVFLSKKQPS